MTGTTHPETQAKRDKWRRGTLTGAKALLGVIGGAAAIVASFIFQTGFAVATGWPMPYAYLYPLCIDAIGAFAGLTAATTRNDKVRGSAAWITAGAILASMLGNAAGHWYATGRIDLAVTLSGLVPAVAIALTVYLFTAERVAQWSAKATSQTPSTSPTISDAAADTAASSAGSTDAPPKPGPRPKGPATTGNAPAAATAAGTALDWSNFATSTRGQLQSRSTDQLLQWITDNGLERASLKDLETKGRLSQRRAQALRRSLDTSSASTSPDPWALVPVTAGTDMAGVTLTRAHSWRRPEALQNKAADWIPWWAVAIGWYTRELVWDPYRAAGAFTVISLLLGGAPWWLAIAIGIAIPVLAAAGNWWAIIDPPEGGVEGRLGMENGNRAPARGSGRAWAAFSSPGIRAAHGLAKCGRSAPKLASSAATG